jgi:hypothetical protein
MLRFLTRRLLVIVAVLIVVNFVGFAYAHAARQAQRTQNPFGSAEEAPPLWSLYQEYALYAIGAGQANP